MINEDSNIQYLKGVGEKRAQALSRLGIFTVGDLLRYYPRTYRDWSKLTSINDASIGEECCIKAIVDRTPTGIKIRKGLTIFKTDATDGESVIKIIIYNNKYAAAGLEPGEEYLFYGKIGGNLYQKEMSSPEILKSDLQNNSIHPIYPQSGDVNTKYIEKLVRQVFIQNPAPCRETIPENVRDSLCLMEINSSLKEFHFPTNENLFSEAKHRLIFEELFILQTGLKKLKGNSKSDSNIIIKNESEKFYKTLPFEPTGAQRRAVGECLEQMGSGKLMNRLLQGDVGSGKTMVAAAIMDSAVRSGYQTVLMAPTEILAAQHYGSVCKFFESSGFDIELLTGSVSAKNKRIIKEKLISGETDILIGTHAVIQSDVIFKNLGVVITDEQHRFGVKQRNSLVEKGNMPHTLVMSATPIPRTLALMIYGDLDISVLDEMPPGRQPIETYCINSSKRERAYNYVKKHLDEGRQGYIVCPLVEENDMLDLTAAEDFAQELAENTFRDYSVGLLHGKMKSKDKDEIMRNFAEGRIQLLVSTTVIEVGVDVPNAVIMVVENAERFGLSQLHQLRGRIGRGKYKSTCILITDARNSTAHSRMKILTQTNDGFRIADEDLRLRGPGNFFGSQQHGLPDLKIAMLTDTFILKEAERFSQQILADDYNLSKPENQCLKKAVDRLFEKNIIMN